MLVKSKIDFRGYVSLQLFARTDSRIFWGKRQFCANYFLQAETDALSAARRLCRFIRAEGIAHAALGCCL